MKHLHQGKGRYRVKGGGGKWWVSGEWWVMRPEMASQHWVNHYRYHRQIPANVRFVSLQSMQILGNGLLIEPRLMLLSR